MNKRFLKIGLKALTLSLLAWALFLPSVGMGGGELTSGGILGMLAKANHQINIMVSDPADLRLKDLKPKFFYKSEVIELPNVGGTYDGLEDLCKETSGTVRTIRTYHWCRKWIVKYKSGYVVDGVNIKEMSFEDKKEAHAEIESNDFARKSFPGCDTPYRKFEAVPANKIRPDFRVELYARSNANDKKDFNIKSDFDDRLRVGEVYAPYMSCNDIRLRFNGGQEKSSKSIRDTAEELTIDFEY